MRHIIIVILAILVLTGCNAPEPTQSTESVCLYATDRAKHALLMAGKDLTAATCEHFKLVEAILSREDALVAELQGLVNDINRKYAADTGITAEFNR